MLNCYGLQGHQCCSSLQLGVSVENYLQLLEEVNELNKLNCCPLHLCMGKVSRSVIYKVIVYRLKEIFFFSASVHILIHLGTNRSTLSRQKNLHCWCCGIHSHMGREEPGIYFVLVVDYSASALHRLTEQSYGKIMFHFILIFQSD